MQFIFTFLVIITCHLSILKAEDLKSVLKDAYTFFFCFKKASQHVLIIDPPLIYGTAFIDFKPLLYTFSMKEVKAW